MPFLEAKHPARLNEPYPSIVEDLLEIAEQHGQTSVDAIIQMLTDLHQHGLDSRYVRKLKNSPLWELKTQTRGGPKGGARVYFFIGEEGVIIVVNAEVKAGDTPSASKFIEALQVLEAYRLGVGVV